MKKTIKAANLFEATITWDTFHKKEESGQFDEELQERIEKKTAEIMGRIDTAAMGGKQSLASTQRSGALSL